MASFGYDSRIKRGVEMIEQEPIEEILRDLLNETKTRWPTAAKHLVLAKREVLLGIKAIVESELETMEQDGGKDKKAKRKRIRVKS